jgi:hypothetical protein
MLRGGSGILRDSENWMGVTEKEDEGTSATLKVR